MMERLLREKLIHGKFTNVALKRSNAMRAVRGSGNKSTELKFTQALNDANLTGWETQKKMIGNPDIVFPAYQVAIFLDGCFWHGCPRCGHIPKTNHAYWETKIERTIMRDKQKTKLLEDQEGYLVIRFWEHELNEDIKQCIELTKEAIEEKLIEISSEIT